MTSLDDLVLIIAKMVTLFRGNLPGIIKTVNYLGPNIVSVQHNNYGIAT